ncbi:pseudouridine synthase [Devosia sp. 1566]|uniref:pseudouridine synthase n=1 Tax=Devosia sp. 1566 TaxID=2499144 RepID=UPI0020BE1DDE|nr:pseudouridine synthase [Devosia sp. 1566]
MADQPASPDTGDRLAKVIARSGLCSRRDAEVWITEGRVAVNGKKVITPAFNVTDRDKVTVDGAPLAARQGTRVWLYHKPAGLVVTEKDPEGRPTIFEALETHGLPRVVSVGRLDINTEGLLLLTNDGGLKRVLELPATGWLRRYRVRAHGTVTQAALDRLKDGTEIDGVKYGSIEATLEREQGSNVWLVMALREGKNREVKNVLGALGLEVNRLIRVSYGPFQLGDIPVGAIETVRAATLRDQLGKKLAEAADVDFDSEMPEANALIGKPTRDRLTGRGTNTVEIARQRFRFTDHAEKTEEELRAERPRQDRPGRFDNRKPGPRRVEEREEYEAPPRRVIFDDGREEEFVAKRSTRAPAFRDRDDQPARSFGKAPERPAKPAFDKPRGPRREDGDRSGPKSFGDKPKRSFGDRPGGKSFGDRPGGKAFGDRSGGKSFGGRPGGNKSFGDRPRPPRPEGGAERPSREFTGTPRGPRRSDAERPQRDFQPRTRADAEAAGAPRAYTPRPDADRAPSRPGRNFSDKPRGNRPDGDRPQRGPRPAGDRPQRPAGARPGGPRPGRDEFGSEAKTYGKPKVRPDGKPHPKREGAAPARGPRPGGFGKPGGARPGASGGARPGGGGRPAGAGRPAGGPRPAGGAGRPSGPRRPKP